MSVVPLRGRPQGRQSGTVKRNVIAALDIGSSKISCLIAESVPARHKVPGAGARDSLKVLGLGHQISRGVRSGAIINVEEAERAIRLAVDAAERMAQTTVSEVIVNVSGGRPQSQCVSATVQTHTGVVSPRDMDAAVAAAIAKLPVGRRTVLHLSPVNFALDDARYIQDPAGLHGEALTADVGVVTVEPAHLQNLGLAIGRAHLGIAGYVLAPYAAARSALAEDELTLGTVLIEMGGATTGVSLFHEGHLVFADVVPVGGLHVTHDIARGLNTTVAHAERMKTLWGSAFAVSSDERDMLAVPLLGERGVDTVHKVPKSVLTGIIRPRIEEIFELVQKKLEQPSLSRFAASRAVLSGGASQLTGLTDLASAMLGRPVRLGNPATLPGLPDIARHAGFTVAAGLLSHGLKPDRHYAMPQQAAAALSHAQLGYVKRVGRWLADSL
jgi:cell division protein FtsA